MDIDAWNSDFYISTKSASYEILPEYPVLCTGMKGYLNIFFRNRGGFCYEFDVMPCPVGGDSRIQTISLFFPSYEFWLHYCYKTGHQKESTQHV